MNHSLLLHLAAIVLALSIGETFSVRAQTTQAEYPLVGMNVDSVNVFSTAWPFMDTARSTFRWVGVNPALGQWYIEHPAIPLTEDGYPGQIEPGLTVFSEAFLNGGHYPVGRYRLSYRGQGDVALTGARFVSSGDGYQLWDVDTVSGAGLRVVISATSPADPVHDIRLELPGYETQSSRFHPLFLEELSAFGVLRFMDWGGTNNSPIQTWQARTRPSDAFWGTAYGAPYEVMVELGNANASDIWLCIPHGADDDFVRRLAQLVRFGSDGQQPYTAPSSNGAFAPLAAQHRVWIEYSNEVWSPGSPGPAQYNYARDVLMPRYGLPSVAQAYGRRAREVFQIFEEVFEGRERLVRVLGGRSGSEAWAEEAMLQVDGQADVLAIAPYIGGEVASGSSIPAHIIQTNYTAPYPDLFAALHDNVEHALRRQVAANAFVAEMHGARLVTYEGGPGVVGTGNQVFNDRLTAYLTELHRQPEWGPVYRDYLDMLREEGVLTYTAYEYVRASSRYGYFGHKEYQDQPLGPSGDPGSAHKLRTLLEWAENPPPPPLPSAVEELIVDNDAASVRVQGVWPQSWCNCFYGANWYGRPASVGGDMRAGWYPTLSGREGLYEIAVRVGGGTATGNQPFSVHHEGGVDTFAVNMRGAVGTWVPLGAFTLHAGDFVSTHNNYSPQAGNFAVVDAIRFTPLAVVGASEYIEWAHRIEWQGGDWQADANPDGDALTNQLEHVLETDPMRANPTFQWGPNHHPALADVREQLYPELRSGNTTYVVQAELSSGEWVSLAAWLPGSRWLTRADAQDHAPALGTPFQYVHTEGPSENGPVVYLRIMLTP